MNLASEWINNIANVEPSTFRRFLRMKGWQERQERSGKAYIFSRSWEGKNTIELEIPIKREFADYQQRVREAIDILSLVESVPPEQIVQNLAYPYADILKFRYIGEEFRDGTISVEDALRIRSARKQLLLSIAHSVVEPLSLFSRLGRSEPLQFLSSCRECPVQAGSYVSQILVPVSPALGQQLAPDVEEPFSRRVTELLAQALYRVTSTLEQGEDYVLLNNPKLGLSSNFLGALSALYPPQNRGTLEIQFSWASARPAPASPISLVRIGDALFPPLTEAARILRETTTLPSYQLEGFVVRLERTGMDASKSGDIVLATTIDDQPGTSKVYMSLSSEMYQMAVKAHATASAVRVTGTLVRQNRRFLLQNPGGFSIVESAES